jgi:hypothetical protein
VEVDQADVPSGCVPIDIGELSETLRNSASHPILLGLEQRLVQWTNDNELICFVAAYKFLQPSYELTLSVQRHGDVNVCVACLWRLRGFFL